MVIGKTHFQQTSVIGLTNLPTQLAWTNEEKKLKKRSMKDTLLHNNMDKSFWTPFDFLMVSIVTFVFLAMVLRYFPSIPEPNWRFRSPMGRLPFFDGVVIYGLALTLVCFIIKFIEIFL